MTQIDSYIAQKEELCRKNDAILPELYGEYGVKRGLRDQSGNGVLAGLTNISKIISFENVNGEKDANEVLLSKDLEIKSKDIIIPNELEYTLYTDYYKFINIIDVYNYCSFLCFTWI